MVYINTMRYLELPDMWNILSTEAVTHDSEIIVKS